MSKISARKNRDRKLNTHLLEQLESRILLAADGCCPRTIEPMIDSPELAPAAVASNDLSIASATIASTGDAGSTRATARNIGTLSGSQTLRGRVGGSDVRDVLRFSVSTRSTLEIDLRGLAADIDLYLLDARGRRLDYSNNSGARSESIDLNVNRGTYYLVISPWGRARSSYTLDLEATSLTRTRPTPTPRPTPPPVAQPPVAEPPATQPPVAQPPVSQPPVSQPPVSQPPVSQPPVSQPPLSQPPGAETPPSNSEPPATRLNEVSYYGGSNEWNLNAIAAPEAWAAGYTGQGVTVAIVDTGIDLDHPDLVNNLWVNPGEIPGNGRDDDGNGYVDDIHGWDFAGRDNRPDDGQGHGTHVAGSVAADANGFGATGVAPDANLMAIRVLGNSGSGSSFDVAAGIRYAAQNGADIINLSLGGGYSSAIQSAIQYAGQLGSVVIAAAGNESASLPGYPARFSANYEHVVSVGAHSSSNRIASFSNDVGGSNAVQIDAPGASVYSTYVGGRYARLSGTSMAAPQVAGLAALILDANPNLTPSQVRSLLVSGAERSIAGSDSRGGATALTSVALAANFTGTPTLSTSLSVVGQRGNFSSSSIRATSVVDQALLDSSPNESSSTYRVARSSAAQTTAAEQDNLAELLATELHRTTPQEDAETSRDLVASAFESTPEHESLDSLAGLDLTAILGRSLHG